MKIKQDCSNCKYNKYNDHLKTNLCTHAEICKFKTFEYWEPKEPFDRYDISNMTIDPCPLVFWCPNKTATCNVIPPDSGCYWYRYFKELIEKTES